MTNPFKNSSPGFDLAFNSRLIDSLKLNSDMFGAAGSMKIFESALSGLDALRPNLHFGEAFVNMDILNGLVKVVWPATKKAFAAVAAISAALIVGGCSNAPSTPAPFDAEVIFSGNTDKIRVSTSTCDFYDGSVKPGINAILRGPDDRFWARPHWSRST